MNVITSAEPSRAIAIPSKILRSADPPTAPPSPVCPGPGTNGDVLAGLETGAELLEIGSELLETGSVVGGVVVVASVEGGGVEVDGGGVDVDGGGVEVDGGAVGDDGGGLDVYGWLDVYWPPAGTLAAACRAVWAEALPAPITL